MEKQNHKKDANKSKLQNHDHEAAKLSDYPDGNIDKSAASGTIPEESNQPQGKSIAEATDPSKLSDL